MEELYNFITLFWKFIKRHLTTDLINGTKEQKDEFLNHYAWFCDRYPKNSPMRNFVEDCLNAFLMYLEEVKKIEAKNE